MQTEMTASLSLGSLAYIQCMSVCTATYLVCDIIELLQGAYYTTYRLLVIVPDFNQCTTFAIQLLNCMIP